MSESAQFRRVIQKMVRGTVVKAAHEDRSILSSLKDLAGVSAIFAALSVLIGWTYLTAYYEVFGVELGMLNVPAYNFSPYFVLAVGYLLRYSAIGMSVALLAAVLIQLTHSGTWILKIVREPFLAIVFIFNKWKSMIVAVSVLLLASGMALIGTNAGKKSAMNTIREPKRVHLFFRDESKFTIERSVVDANNARRLGLVGQSKDLVVVFEPGKESRGPKVYVLSRFDLCDVEISN